MKKLLAKSGPLEGSAYSIDGHIVMIGRDGDCDIQLIDANVSRRHACVVEQDDGSVLVRDLVSHNGTYVRGTKVVEALLAAGDEFSVGTTRFQYLEDNHEVETNELDIKLVSGPAVSPTLATPLSATDRAEILELARKRRAETAPALCCGSPAALEARKQGWKFCPACGADIKR